MELPDLGQFRTLLQESGVFRDYINTFLNLPIFPKRFTYNKERGRFEIDPPVISENDVADDSSVFDWVYEHRLPLFWHSELFLEYCLSSKLQDTNKELVGVMGSVPAMSRFRNFLFGGEGESACLFWLDVERLSHLDKARARPLMTKINHLYLKEDSPFSLSSELKEQILFASKLGEGKTGLPLAARVKALLQAQRIVLGKLAFYWCKQYLLHLTETQSVHVDLLKTTSTIKFCRRDGTTNSSLMQLPRITRDETSTNTKKSARKLPQVAIGSCKLPHIPTGSCSLISNVCTGVSGVGQLLDGRCARNSLQLAITQSTQELFPQSVRLSTESLLGSAQHSQSLYPYLYAALRSDFLAGNPFLRHLSSVEQATQKAINHLLFWQSVELIFTRDEMRRHVSSSSHCILITHTEGYPTANNLKQLLYLFIRDRALHQLDLPTPVRRELVALLAKGLGHNLLISVQEHVAECLVRPWIEFMLQEHQDFTSSCTTQRLLDRRHTSYCSRHSMAGIRSDCIVQQTYGSSQLPGMWNALRLAESAKYPGIQLLPSRRLMDVSLQKTEVEDDEDSSSEDYSDSIESSLDVSLNPMLTTVYTITCRRPKKFSQRILCRTLPAYSTDLRHKRKPHPPKSFMEVLKVPEQREAFRHFLQQQGGGAETQLLFWTAVEDLKKSVGNKRTCRSKTKTIHQQFFRSATAERLLQCRDPTIAEMTSQGRASPFQLLAAQVTVADTMEKAWYQRYVAYLTADEDEEEEEAEEQKKPACREHTKGLWNMFAVNVVSFRRGLMNQATADLFRSFLREEVIKGSGTSGTKKVIGTKVVNVTKLLNDLSFWVEVERYKNLADIVNAAKAKGTHTPEDDIMVFKKAHAIVNCYIDSAVSPRVQINIPNEIVQYILDNISQGLISRGLFHEAALNIFSVLILYWKRFCVVRYAPVPTEAVNKQSHIAAPSSRQVSTTSVGHRRGSHLHKHRLSQLYPTPSLFEGIDCGPILSFSLSHGLRWIKPTHAYLHGQEVDSL